MRRGAGEREGACGGRVWVGVRLRRCGSRRGRGRVPLSRFSCALVLLETCSTGVCLALGVCLDLTPLRLVDVEGGAGEDEPGELPGAGALAGGDIGCCVLEFAAAEGDKVYRV